MGQPDFRVRQERTSEFCEATDPAGNLESNSSTGQGRTAANQMRAVTAPLGPVCLTGVPRQTPCHCSPQGGSESSIGGGQGVLPRASSGGLREGRDRRGHRPSSEVRADMVAERAT